MPSSDVLLSIPFQGSGLGYRFELKAEIWKHREEIDCLEIITDRYIEHPHLIPELEELCDAFHVIPHGIGLSIGSPAMDLDYVRSLRAITQLTKASYYSEHLCQTRAPGIDIGHLAPLWFTEEVLAHTVANVQCVQEMLGMPLILENTTYPFVIPHADMSQTEFFHRLVDATGCGILLDITNIRINAENHQFDPVEFLEQMPLDRVIQLHTSGGYRGDDGSFIDGHCAVPDDAVWSVLEAFAARGRAKAAILEHDTKFPDDFSDLISTLNRTREIMRWGTSAKGSIQSGEAASLQEIGA